jgi:quinol-cytochrome oxidoreductase complex cytochrome b subunit
MKQRVQKLLKLHQLKLVKNDNNVLIPIVLNELFFYPTPNNFNYFYCVGFLLGLLLCFQFISGVLVACYYIPKVGIAFTSVDYAIRDVAIG